MLIVHLSHLLRQTKLTSKLMEVSQDPMFTHILDPANYDPKSNHGIFRYKSRLTQGITRDRF